MPSTEREVAHLGFDAAVGVPDTRLRGIITDLVEHIPVYFTPREDVAVAAACGMELAGGRPLLFMKNAGLLTCGDALLSLARDLHIGLFLLVGRSGGLDGLPHHSVSEDATVPFLDALSIEWRAAGPGALSDPAAVADFRAWQRAAGEQRQHCALLVSD